MTRTAEDIVRQEVLCCLSSIVADLAAVYGSIENSARANERGNGLGQVAELVERAFELARPVDDYEKALREAGYKIVRFADEVGFTYVPLTYNGIPSYRDMSFTSLDADDRDYAVEQACMNENLDPYKWEVFAHWAVTEWLADKLEEQGERVDRDFGGLCVWARTTTGQQISADEVIEKIARDLANA